MTTAIAETPVTETVPVAQPITRLPVLLSVTDETIAKLRAEYASLSVSGVTDEAGALKCREGRMKCVKARSAIESARVELKKDVLERGRQIDGEAKRLTKSIEPLEAHLLEQEEIVSKEKERVAKARENAMVADRTAKLAEIGADAVPDAILRHWSDDEFKSQLALIAERVRLRKEAEARAAAEETERKRLAAEEAERNRLEAARLAADREALAQEKREQRELLDRIHREAEENNRKLAVEQKKLDDEKARVESARLAALGDARLNRIVQEVGRDVALSIPRATLQTITDEEFESQVTGLILARDEAAEKARLETEERVKRQNEAAERRIREEREAREKAERLKPARERLLAFADSVAALAAPDFPSNMEVPMERIRDCLDRCADDIRDIADKLTTVVGAG